MMLILISSAFITVRVPRFEETTRNAPIAAPRAQGVSADAFGAGLGAGLQQAGDSMGAIAKKELEEQDASRINKAQADYESWKVKYLHDDQSGLLSTNLGEKAIGLETPAVDARKKYLDDAMGGLGNERQKRLFQMYVEKDTPSYLLAINKHEAGEGQKVKIGNAKAATVTLLDTVKSMAASSSFDATAFNEQIGKLMDKVNVEAAFHGYGKDSDYAKAQRDAALSEAHKSRVLHLMGVNATAAQSYLDGVVDKIGPEDREHLVKSLTVLTTKQKGMDTALELAPLLGAKPLTEVLGKVRTRLKSNPDALNIAETQLKQMEAERRDQLKQEADAVAKPVYKRIAEIQLSGRAAKLSDIPAAEWAELVRKAPEEAGKIQDAIRRELQGEEDRRERKLDREERKADRAERKAEQGTMTQMLNWAALNGDPDSLLQANLDALYTQRLIGKEHYRSLSTKQAELRANPDRGVAIRTENQTVEDVLGAVKLKKGSDEHAQAWDFIEARKRMFVAENNRQPTRKELQDIARESVYKVDVSGSVFDKPSYRVIFDDIPKAERAKIVDAFNRRGRAYSEAEVVRAYVKSQMKGGR